MLAAIVRDAWRQCRRRPVAVLVTAAVIVALRVGPAHVPNVRLLVLPASILLELFLVAYLGAPLRNPTESPPGVGAALRTVRALLTPGLLAFLLKAVYSLMGISASRLLLGNLDEISEAQASRVVLGAWPLVAFGFAFLAVLVPHILLDGERRLRRAAGLSHRVALGVFPLCLLIGLLESSDLPAGSLSGIPGQLALGASGLADVFRMAMANALLLHTRPLQATASPDRAP